MRRFGFLVCALVFFAAFSSKAADNSLSAEANAAFLAAYDKKPGVIIKPDGLRYRILHNGFGRRPRPQDYVTVNYTGSLINGQVFDGTEPGMPARFKANSLISGWTEALSLMRVGDRWEVVIPPSLGYGERGTPEGTIPPNQVLVFQLELIKTVPP
ncbi:MAG TPA: FKBP-type peptidyl-prolyl cis-trans isomerase, partial [Rhizomicrobium sp.]